MSVNSTFQIDATTAQSFGRGADVKGFQVPYVLEAPQNVNASNPSFELKLDDKKLNAVETRLGLTNQKPDVGLTNDKGFNARNPRHRGHGHYSALVDKRAPKFAQEAKARLGQASPESPKQTAKPEVAQTQTISLGQDSPIVKQQMKLQREASGMVPTHRSNRLGLGVGMLRTVGLGLVTANPIIAVAAATTEAALVTANNKPFTPTATTATATRTASPNPVQQQMLAMQQRRNRMNRFGMPGMSAAAC